MSSSYGIIRRHEGQVSVESEVGRGTTFRITLPVAKIEAESRHTPEPVAWMPQLSTAHKPRILVVDDEAHLREVLCEILERGGYEVVLAEEGREALELFDVQRFDAVFTDIGMPGMNGWELVRSIRERDEAIPVAVITGWGDAVDEQECKAAGVNWVVTKPFTAARIVELARQASQYLREPCESAEAFAVA